MISERRELSCRAVYHVRVLYVSRILGYLSFPTIWQMRLTQAHTIFYHGHGLFLQFFGFFRSLEDLFTSAYYEGNQAVK